MKWVSKMNARKEKFVKVEKLKEWMCKREVAKGIKGRDKQVEGNANERKGNKASQGRIRTRARR